MATDKPWYAWYPKDFMTDDKVAFLSRSAELTYRRLLDYCWIKDASLPNNETKLAGMARLSVEDFHKDWAEIQQEDDPCFVAHPEDAKKLTNKRMFKEWLKAKERIEKARENGKRGGRPKKGSGKQKKPNPFQKKPNPNRNQSSSSSSSSSPSSSKSPPKKGDSGPPGPPPCPHQKIIDLYHQELPTLPRVEVWSKYRKGALQARWREEPARQNLTWWREYFKQVAGQPFLLGQNDRQWSADLEWLIRPKNMPRVLENKYRENVPGTPEAMLSSQGQRNAANVQIALDAREKLRNEKRKTDQPDASGDG